MMRNKRKKYGMKKMVLLGAIMAFFLITISSNVMAEKQMTPKDVVQLTKKVIDLLETKGTAAFPELRGKEFLFGSTYPTILTLSGKLIFHPVMPHLEGKANLLKMKDKNGKLFVAELLSVARNKGSGWVEYMWTKAGEKGFVNKVSYILSGTCDGEDVACMIGLYDYTKEECVREAGE